MSGDFFKQKAKLSWLMSTGDFFKKGREDFLKKDRETTKPFLEKHFLKNEGLLFLKASFGAIFRVFFYIKTKENEAFVEGRTGQRTQKDWASQELPRGASRRIPKAQGVFFFFFFFFFFGWYLVCWIGFWWLLCVGWLVGWKWVCLACLKVFRDYFCCSL